MNREILQQALHHLVDLADDLRRIPSDIAQTIAALEAELAKPEQEPVAWRNAAIRLGEDLYSVGPNGYYDMTAKQWLDWALSVVNTAPPPQELAKPEQEPVALKMVYGEVCCQSKHDDQSFGMWCPITEEEFPNGTPFYTAPPRKEWVGLTDKEILDLWVANHKNTGATDAFACAVEAKLKEKNT